MIISMGIKLESYGRITIPKYMLKEMQLKTGNIVGLYFVEDHITLNNPLLDIMKAARQEE